ncbi:50S ribosomal protein L14e [Candidatus Woesearchaeota archaeon]|nr:50S ribosomal protein L14e [Candidatus Woesearchaeota archaeon]
MIEIGRLAIKTAGRDAGCKCVVVEILDNNYVLIDGGTRRRKCNIIHLEPLNEVIKIKKGASHEEVNAEFKKLKLEVRETKPKETKDRPKKVRKEKKKIEEKGDKGKKKAKKEGKKKSEVKKEEKLSDKLTKEGKKNK